VVEVTLLVCSVSPRLLLGLVEVEVYYFWELKLIPDEERLLLFDILRAFLLIFRVQRGSALLSYKIMIE